MLSDQHFLRIAGIVSEAGTCTRLQVGALLVYARRIISTGYNGAPAGMPHCKHLESEEEPCIMAVHAESNAVAFAAKHGVPTDGSSLYTTDSPCVVCARLIINAGIKEVIYGREYRDTSGLREITNAGIYAFTVDKSGLRVMRDFRGDVPEVYPSQPSDEAFDEGWTKYSESHRGGGSGI